MSDFQWNSRRWSPLFLGRAILVALLFGVSFAPYQVATAQTSSSEPLQPASYQLYLPLLRNGSSSSTAVATPTLSTPLLIEEAFTRGEITAGERALYLAYALYEPKSLPARFQSNVGWHGTRYVKDVQNYLQNVNAAASDVVQQELSRLTTVANTICHKADGATSSDSANFHFNYNTISGTLTLADYSTALETSFDLEVIQYGWGKPPLCTGGATCNGNTNLSGRFPVQIFPLSAGLYGYVINGGALDTGWVGDNPNTPATETNAYASCMVLNNDFSLFPEGERAALDATTAHEFVHAIQNGYGTPNFYTESMWYESSAAYMEDEVYDNSNSNYRYLWPVITNSLGQWPSANDPNGVSEYSNFLFFRHVAEHNGGTNLAGGGEDILQHFWENIAAGQEALNAYNNALATKGTNLPDEFHRYAIAAKFSKACGAGYAAPYCFEEGDAYVAFASAPPASQWSIAANPGSYTGSIENNYAGNWVDLPTTGSPYQITLNNTASAGRLRGAGQLRGSVVCDTGTTFRITPFASVVGAGSSTAIDNFDASGCVSVVAVITNQEQTGGDPSTIDTNDYTLSVNAPPPPTPTSTPTATATPTQTGTPTPTATSTQTSTSTPTATPTQTGTPTPTNTPSPTDTPTARPTDTPTRMGVPFRTPTATPTPLPTDTPTNTPTPTDTPTDTPTSIPTPTLAKVNAQLLQAGFKIVGSTTAPDAAYPAQSPKGVMVLTFGAKNLGGSLRNVTFEMQQLTNNNYLLNADGGPGRTGSRLTLPNSALPNGDQQWDLNEMLGQNFSIGLMSRSTFSIRVDVYAIATTVAARTNGLAANLQDSFSLEVDPNTLSITSN